MKIKLNKQDQQRVITKIDDIADLKLHQVIRELSMADVYGSAFTQTWTVFHRFSREVEVPEPQQTQQESL